MLPVRPDELGDDRELSREDGLIFVGDKGKTYGKIYVEGWDGENIE